MKKVNEYTRLLAIVTALIIVLSSSGPVLATDDGARAYWKGRAGTNVFSFQYLRWDIDATGSLQFDPGSYIYPGSDTEASVFVLSWARHMTLINRPTVLSVNLLGGTVDVDADTGLVPPEFLGPGVVPSDSFRQSSSGYADPNVQLLVNLLGTPPLKSTVDLLNYEPGWTLDAAVMLGVPIGEYDGDKFVNLGLNRWYGRLALPVKYHFGVFAPGYMSSFELIPSVWLFAENDDFVGQRLDNDPLWQLEAHLTHDFTKGFFASLDALFRGGFQSEINGTELGDELDVGNIGFTLNFQITDNVTMRTGYSSNVFGDKNLDNSILRMQFVYAWHRVSENVKKLQEGH
jgi:hypothetical protein